MQDILIIDSNEHTLTALGDQLLLDGYEVLDARAERQARHHLANSHPDAVILQTLDTPAHTLALLRDLRAGHLTGADPRAPVLTVGADSDHTAVRHYQSGADIALPSTASPLLISASLQALGQRDPAQRRRILRAGNLTVDTTARTATVQGTPVPLSRLEFDLLAALAAQPNRAFTRAELNHDVWGYDPTAPVSRTLETHAARVRQKLHAAGAEPLIQNIRGVGYRLTS